MYPCEIERDSEYFSRRAPRLVLSAKTPRVMTAGPSGVAAPGQPPPNPILELIRTGPVVQVTISPHSAIIQQLLAQGITTPPTVTGNALIDTGASLTCIDLQAATTLKVPEVGQVQISSASHAATLQPVYPVHFQFVGITITMDAPRVAGAPLAAQGLVALLGRDALRTCVFIYNGIGGHFTLAVA